MSTKPEVVEAFRKAGIDTSKAVPYNGCALIFPGDRYVAYFKDHEGFQVGKGRSPEGRIVVPAKAAKSWAEGGEFPEGTPAKQGYTVKDGVEKGRKAPEAQQVQTISLDKPVIDTAKGEKAKAALELARSGFTPEQVIRLLGV